MLLYMYYNFCMGGRVLSNLFVKGSVGSDIGISRNNNEDNFYLNGRFGTFNEYEQTDSAFQPPIKDGIFAVFDGMGGQSRGEFASLCGAEILRKYKNGILKNGNSYITKYIEDANNIICTEIKKTQERIGSTMAVLKISDGIAQSYNLGDSSVYYISKNKITKLSRDHTVAEQMYQMNAITAEEAQRDVRKHRLTKHLGMFEGEGDLKPYISNNIRISNGDMFILCTDGVTNVVSEKEIKRIATIFDGRCKKTVNAIIEKAIENGSDDNITVMVLRIVNSTNSRTRKRGLARHPHLYPFLLGLGFSAIICTIIILLIISKFT